MGIRSAIRRLFSRTAAQPLKTAAQPQELIDMRRQHGSYDAARTSTEYQNIWANADYYDADSANSRFVREKLVTRSRYEINNNGYSDGIAQTYATDIIGCGPNLRMQTGSDGFNRMVENTWYQWCKATQFRRALWCMAHAKHSDGETFGIIRKNPRVKHPIPMQVVLIETEQCRTPWLPVWQPGYIDGIRFDEFGNPVYFDILHQHPGSVHVMQINQVPERVAADYVLHWFKLRRPGQHRGIPEMSSTLNTGAAARRWREATLGAAETAADFTLFLKTQMTPDEADLVTPMSTLDIQKRMMTALPAGYEATQMKPEHPTANYESFHKTLVNEQARPKSMPFNKAACDSSSYNYASGRLDHQTYYAALDVEREDCNDLVLDPLFDRWFDLAIAKYRWLGGNPDAVGASARAHLWDWPKHAVADVESEANANKTQLTSGQKFLPRQFSEAGFDIDDEITAAAAAFDVDESVIRARLLDITLPPPARAVPVTPGTDEAVAAPAAPAKPAPAKAAEAVLNRLNGNGATHAN